MLEQPMTEHLIQQIKNAEKILENVNEMEATPGWYAVKKTLEDNIRPIEYEIMARGKTAADRDYLAGQRKGYEFFADFKKGMQEDLDKNVDYLKQLTINTEGVIQ